MKRWGWAACVAVALAAAAPAAAPAAANPLMEEWTAPHGAPPFDAIKPEHFRPAYDAAMAAQRAAIDAIVADPSAPSFDNTIAPFERSGAALARLQPVFGAFSGAHSNDEIRAVERELSPVLARHGNDIHLNAGLFARIAAVHETRGAAGLTAEQVRLVERIMSRFERAGARLEGAARRRFAEINERLATLSTRFGQNVLADEREFVLVLDGPDDLAGLPPFFVEAAAAAAAARGHEGGHVVTLARSSVEQFLQFSSRRDLRETAWRAWIMRGDNGDAEDNKAVIAEIVRLRNERAKLLGFPTHAHFVLDDRMAKTPEAAQALMDQVWAPARERADADAAELQKLIDAEGGGFALAPWDWRFYAEKLRTQRFGYGEADVKPYLQLDKMIEAQFYVANRLWGLTFAERTDVPVYEPTVRVWEVKDRDGRHVGLFYGDYFARASKRSGAWATAYRRQERMDAPVTPLIGNVCSYALPAGGGPALLSYDDAETLFHEFGHALHGLLSDVTYPTLAGTAVPTDFVEFPAQIYEHWLLTPEILGKFAVHYRTGAPMPKEMMEKLISSRTFDQGFATVEFLSGAIFDMDTHLLADPSDYDVAAQEKATLARIAMPEAIVMRHRPTHFQHVFSGGYAAGYYSYMWSEVLDTDGFGAFREAGDVFDPQVAARLRTYVYSAGNLRDAAEAYRLFRGRDPVVEPLLRHRGFLPAEN